MAEISKFSITEAIDEDIKLAFKQNWAISTQLVKFYLEKIQKLNPIHNALDCSWDRVPIMKQNYPFILKKLSFNFWQLMCISILEVIIEDYTNYYLKEKLHAQRNQKSKRVMEFFSIYFVQYGVLIYVWKFFYN